MFKERTQLSCSSLFSIVMYVRREGGVFGVLHDPSLLVHFDEGLGEGRQQLAEDPFVGDYEPHLLPIYYYRN